MLYVMSVLMDMLYVLVLCLIIYVVYASNWLSSEHIAYVTDCIYNGCYNAMSLACLYLLCVHK